jgi:hypothetical protein
LVFVPVLCSPDVAAADKPFAATFPFKATAGVTSTSGGPSRLSRITLLLVVALTSAGAGAAEGLVAVVPAKNVTESTPPPPPEMAGPLVDPGAELGCGTGNPGSSPDTG